MIDLNEQELKKLLDRLISLRISLEAELENSSPGSDSKNRGKLMRELRAVRRACRKIECGAGFGACERCGEEIGYGALKMDPAKQECWRCDPKREDIDTIIIE